MQIIKFTGTAINKEICMTENWIFNLKTKNILKNGWSIRGQSSISLAKVLLIYFHTKIEKSVAPDYFNSLL